MRFDTKIAIVVREDLAPWQRLNVTAFLAGGLAGGVTGAIGEPYQDASGNAYLALFRQPVLVYEGDLGALRGVREKAVGRGMDVAVYVEEMFKTGHDADNRAVVARVRGEELDLVGVAVHGAKNGVDKVLKGLRLHS
ncbi:DUF2000 domain-containing protein [Nonomuraea maheshkhaliensis]